MKVQQLIEAVDLDYYMTEGCGIFAMALSFLKPGGQIYIASNTQGEKWSKSIPFEVTHVVYRVNGKTYDAMGETNSTKVANHFHIDGSMDIKGPYQPMDFFKKFMGNNDTKPLYGTQADIKEAMVLAQKQNILESVVVEAKSAPLYHATNLYKAVAIIEEDFLKGTTDQYIAPHFDQDINSKMVKGVSLTRSLAFAKTFENVSNHSRVTFVIDQLKLSQRYKIVPLDYFTTHPDAGDALDWDADEKKHLAFKNRRQNKYAESEEFVVGDIKNLHNYITKIIISKGLQKFTEEEQMNSPSKPAAREWVRKYEVIKNHPKAVME